jgi:hypothetical protein
MVQTDELPPNQGRKYLLIKGWIWKRRKAERKVVREKIIISKFQMLKRWKSLVFIFGIMEYELRIAKCEL